MKPSDLAVTHHFAELPALRMHYVEAGAGPLVLLLHGFPETWWSWRYQIEPLARAGFRVIVPDLRGYGETGKQGPYDLDTVSADIAALLAHLGEKEPVRIVGHDWGGALAWHIAATLPQLCAKLAVLNCPHPAMMAKAFRTRWRQVARSWYMFFFLLPRLPERFLTADGAVNIVRMIKGSAIDRRHFTLEELQPYRDAALKEGAAAAMVGWYRAAILSARKAKRYPPIAAPTLLIWGKDDSALGFDDLVPGTERHVPALRIEQVEKCGHFVHEEQPEQVNVLLSGFLSAPL